MGFMQPLSHISIEVSKSVKLGENLETENCVPRANNKTKEILNSP
jgi:hypothetical protein